MNIPESFIANILSRLQQETVDAGGLLKGLDDLLTALPPQQDHSEYIPFTLRIPDPADSITEAARILAYSRFPLKFQVRNRDAAPEFLLSTTFELQQSLLTLLKTSIPGLQAEPYTEEQSLPMQSFACFSCLDQDPGREVSGAWIDAISGLSLPGCWCVCLEAVPLTQSDSWTLTQITAAEALYAKLMELSQITCAITQPIPPDPKNSGQKWQKTTDPGQFTATSRKKNPQIDRAAIRADNIVNNLDRLLREGGWTVRLTLQTQTSEQMETLQSLLQATFCSCGTAMGWEERDHPTVLTRAQLASTVSVSRVSGCGCHSVSPASIPSEQLQKPFGILGADRKTAYGLLQQLLSGRKNVFFLIIDPEGSSYRDPASRTYTLRPGNENSIRINPFRFPQGASVAWHIQALTDLLTVAWDLDSRHRTVLEQSISECYTGLGWNLITDTNYYSSILEEQRLYPTFDTLAEVLSGCSDRQHQNLLQQLDRFVTGIPGAALNDSHAVPLSVLLSSAETVTVDLSALVSHPAKQVAMGSLLIELAQYPDALSHIPVLKEADLLLGRETENTALEDAVQKLTEKRAGPVFISRSVSSLPRYLLDFMEGCISHRLSARDQGEELLRFFRPEQGRLDLHTLDTGLAMIRFGDMRCAGCFRIAPQPTHTEECPPAVASAADPRDLVRHLLEISADLNQVVQERMEPLYFQILFDTDRDNLTAALRENLFEPIRSMLAHHTLMDMIQNADPETLVLQLVEQSFGRYIRKRSILGHGLQNLMEMYVFRILRLVIRGGYLRETDWRILQDYRRSVLEPRYRDMVLRSRGTLHETICHNVGVHTHSELLVQILVDLHRYQPHSCTEEETAHLVQSLARQYLLKLPPEEQLNRKLANPVYRCLQEEE